MIKKHIKIISVTFLIIMFIILANSCVDRRSYSFEELQNNLIKIELVEFGDFDELETQSDKNIASYCLFKVLNNGDVERFIQDLAGVEFASLLCEPRLFYGKGVILTYTNKKIYISSFVLYEAYTDGTFYRMYYSGSSQFDSVIEKYWNN